MFDVLQTDGLGAGLLETSKLDKSGVFSGRPNSMFSRLNIISGTVPDETVGFLFK